jgi:hypothetical protein
MLPLTRDEARRIAANIAKILASGDYFTPENPSALGLIRSLGENGVIRIGGNTSERTVWGADRRPVGPASFVITPGVVAEHLKMVLSVIDRQQER